MMKIAAVIVLALCASGCVTVSRNMMVLQYHDFGPQAAAYQAIGMEWWQWDNHGDPDPNFQYDVKVVVYRDIPLSQVREAYPVVKSKQQDFRYLAYTDAMAYLNTTIQEDAMAEVTQRLKLTRAGIEKELGNADKVLPGDAVYRARKR
jgi:hypothetical protein